MWLQNWRTPLHRAAWGGHLPVVEFMIEKHGATVDARDQVMFPRAVILRNRRLPCHAAPMRVKLSGLVAVPSLLGTIAALFFFFEIGKPLCLS